MTCDMPVDVDAAGRHVGRDERVDACRDSNPASARSRWPCDLSPCMATAVTPCEPQPLHEPVGAALGAHEDECQLAVRRAAPRPARRPGRRAPRRRSGARSAALRCAWGVCSWRTASRVYSRAMRPASPSSVAEKNSVWRLAGHWADDAVDGRAGSPCRACGRPRRAPGSARRASETARRSSRSSSRPGVATTMWALAAVARLLCDADAAVDGGDLQRAGVGDGSRLLHDLARQLAGRGEHEGARGGGRWRRSGRPAGSRRRASCRTRWATSPARRGRRGRRRSPASGLRMAG